MTVSSLIRSSIFLILIVVATPSVWSAAATERIETNTQQSDYEHLDQFIDVLTLVRKNYVEQVSMQELVHGAINGMLADLDPHSAFMPPELYQEMQIETQGEFNGLGIEITVKDHTITVIAPIADTPADRAGIKAGDKVIKINDRFTKDMSIMDAIKMMRGPRGSTIEIGIIREGVSSPLSFTLVREIIRINSIKQQLFEPALGYIRISQFQKRTVRDLKAALEQLRDESGQELKGLVLDLRNNPGGLLDQGVQVCDLFLNSGKIVSTQGRKKSDNFSYTASAAETEVQYPIVILINGGSASAAEIVAGALQDHQRAVVLGTQSFGKGSVQTVIPLSDKSGLRLTTAHYYTPNGTSIQARGITPDVIVEQAVWKKVETFELPRESDLDNHLQAQEHSDHTTHEQKNSSDSPDSDFQLLRALDLLRGWQQMKNLKSTANVTNETPVSILTANKSIK